MLSSAEHNRRVYPFAGVYSENQVGTLDLETPVGLRSAPLKTYMNGGLLEVLLRNKRIFTMEQSLFPTMGDLLSVPWEGAAQQLAAWRANKKPNHHAIDVDQALVRISGRATANSVESPTDSPEQPMSQAEYEKLYKCQWNDYKPSTQVSSAKREANSPASAEVSKKQRPSKMQQTLKESKETPVITLDDEAKPARRSQVGRVSSDTNPSTSSPTGDRATASAPPAGTKVLPVDGVFSPATAPTSTPPTPQEASLFPVPPRPVPPVPSQGTTPTTDMGPQPSQTVTLSIPEPRSGETPTLYATIEDSTATDQQLYSPWAADNNSEDRTATDHLELLLRRDYEPEDNGRAPATPKVNALLAVEEDEPQENATTC